MLFLTVREKQSMQNFRIKSTRKTIHISYFGWMYTTLIGSSGVEPVSVPKIKNSQGSNSCKKLLLIFRKKSKFKAARVSTSSRTAFRKGNKFKKISGFKIESVSEINSIPAIKGNLGLFELCNFCQTVYSAFSSGMGR